MWDATAFLILIGVVTLVVVMRGFMMIVTVLRTMSGHFESDGGARFMIADDTLCKIGVFLLDEYKAKSLEEVRIRVLGMITNGKHRTETLASKQSKTAKASGPVQEDEARS